MFAHLLAVLSTDNQESLHGQEGDLRSVWVNQLMRQAARIAINRTVAGVHFPVDSVAGTLLGLTLAEYLINLCTPERESYQFCRFDGAEYPEREGDRGANADFNWQDFYNVETRRLTLQRYNQGALALADRGDDVEDPRGQVRSARVFALGREALVGKQREKVEQPKFVTIEEKPLPETSKPLEWLWNKAKREWSASR
jgi:hypothetical protein